MHVYVADDDESPRLARGGFGWRTALPLLLIALAGGYGALVVAARFSPSFAATIPWQAIGMTDGLKLPFLAQLASAFAGLAALVMVLAAAVRAVDTHPYAAIAPVIAVFSGLVEAGLRVDLPFAGFSSPAIVACAVLVVALIGGALIGREGLSVRVLGWVLVTAPCGLLLSAFTMGLGQTGDSSMLPGLDSSQRLFLGLLCGSSLLLGLAGVVASQLRGRAQRGELSMQDASGWGSAGSQPGLYPYRTDEGRAVQWNRGGFGRPLQAGVVLLAVAAGAYFAVDRLKHGSDVSAANPAPAWTSPAGAPVVEQLSATAPSKSSGLVAATEAKRSRAAKQGGARSAAGRDAPAPAPAVEERRPAQPKKPEPVAKRAESRPARPVAGKRGAALPAWGSEATEMQSFATQKPGKAAAAQPSKPARAAPVQASSALASDPAAPVATKAVAPAAPSRPIAPPVSKPAPPAPPPAPAKQENLTMDQLLNRVVDVARQSQPNKPSKGGAKSQRDSEIDDLLNAAMKPKGK